MPTHGAGELLSTGFVLVAPCPGYPRPHLPRPNPRSVRLSAVAGRLTPVHCIPGSFVPRLPRALSSGRYWQEIKGWEEREGGLSLPCPLPLGWGAWLEPCWRWEPSLLWESPSPLSPASSSPSTFPGSLRRWEGDCFGHCQPLGKNPSFAKFSSKSQWMCLPCPAGPRPPGHLLD